MIVAGLYFGRELLVPLVLATLLAFVLAPACALLQRIASAARRRAWSLTVLFAFAVIGSIGAVVVSQADDAGGDAAGLPSDHGDAQMDHALPVQRRPDRTVGGRRAGGTRSGALSERHLAAVGLDGPVRARSVARTVAQPLLGPVTTAGIVLVFTIFILLSSEDLRDRLVRLVGRRDLHRTILAMNDAARRLSRYFLFQLVLNTGFGTIIGVGIPGWRACRTRSCGGSWPR